MRSLRKLTLASVLGNAIEMYDFTLYGIFSPILASLFFPNNTPSVAMLLTLSVFAIGFIVRPLGGILFGHLGDQVGRKQALTLSIFLMAIPTILIGILPTYDQIGFAAPFLLILCRLLQGLCAGGEYIGASVFIVEHYKKYSLEGFSGGLIAASGAIGSLIAMVLGFILLQTTNEWAWRIPFILGGSVGIVGYYIRRHLTETPEFIQFIHENTPSQIPLKESILRYPFSLACSIGTGISHGALAFSAFVYLNIYFNKQLGIALHQSMAYNALSLLSFLIFVPAMGYLADKLSPRKVMLFGAIINMTMMYFIFILFNMQSIGYMFCGLLLFNLVIASFIGPANALYTSLFPVSSRYSGIAFGYGIGSALAGGTMPFFSTLLIDITDNTMAPSYYLMGCTLIGFLAVYMTKYSVIFQKSNQTNFDEPKDAKDSILESLRESA